MKGTDHGEQGGYGETRKETAGRYIPRDLSCRTGRRSPDGIALDRPDGPEFRKQLFRKTFIYGSYDGRVIFYEPMVSMAYLEEKRANAPDYIKLRVYETPASPGKPTA